MPKIRLDILLVEKGLIQSRALAQRMVLAGQVLIDGIPAIKPGMKYSSESQVTIIQGPRYVSRGGEKLESALQTFQIDVTDKICADIGASTGGFTDCLLQYGAARVYAIDVGHGILAWKLRQNPQVVVMENTNARFIDKLPELVDIITIDASFISLKIFFPVIRDWFRSYPGNEDGGSLVALIKPQFEAGKQEVSHTKGVIRNPETHQKVLKDVLSSAMEEGYHIQGLIRSPLLGPKGNKEFLVWLSLQTSQPQDTDQMVKKALE